MTTVEVRRLPDGVAIRIRAPTPDGIKALQEETRARVAGLQAHR